MKLMKRKIHILCLAIVMIIGNGQICLAEGYTFETSVTPETIFEGFFIQPGEEYSFTNIGEKERDIFLGADGVADYVISYYDDKGTLINEAIFSMDGFGGPRIYPGESAIISVDEKSAYPVEIVSYGVELELEKIDKLSEATLNQSKISFDGWRWFDTSHGIHYELKNDTNVTDITNMALIFYSNKGGEHGFVSEIHFFEEIILEPGEVHRDLFHTQFFAEYVLDEMAKVIVVKFETVEELKQLKETVPPNNLVNQAYDIETSINQGDAGKQWFKNNFNIDIKK